MAFMVYSIFLMLLISSTSATWCDECFQSKASFFRSSSTLSSGACGYGSLAMNLYGGHVAAAVPSIYNDGIGCGSCFQIRCKHSDLCSEAGTKMVVTDTHTDKSNTTDFVLSSRAFRAMALPGKDKQLLKVGIAQVEYRRIPCVYKGQNLAIRVEEFSKFPNYLAIKVLYQGGQTRILLIEVSTVDQNKSIIVKSMSHNYGAVWDTNEAPEGPLRFRFAIMLGYDHMFLDTEQVLPENWKPGVTYNTTVQMDSIEAHGCAPCGDWK